MINLKKSKKKAVTLLELVIVLGLMSLVTMLVFNFSSLTQKKEKELDIKQELQHRGNMITESFMSNILQCKNIDETTILSSVDNSVSSIVFNIDGEAKFNTIPVVENVIKLEYRLEDNKLKLYGWNRNNPADPDDINTDKIEIQTIAEDVISMKILNRTKSDNLINLSNGDIKIEKGVNLEVKLKKKDIEQPITIDLNLRNFN